MDRHLYTFAGFPRLNRLDQTVSLNAGGLAHCIEEVEELGELESDPTIQLRKEGVFRVNAQQQGEKIEDFTVVVSPRLIAHGITWDWFPSDWCFGNRITMHKTHAGPEMKTVIHGTELSEDEYLDLHRPTPMSELAKTRLHIKHDGWKKYETRWLPGTCPQENHVVHITWLSMTHRLPEFVVDRLTGIIEQREGLKDEYQYSPAHFSSIRKYNGESPHRRL
jgi:hypothetical protein